MDRKTEENGVNEMEGRSNVVILRNSKKKFFELFDDPIVLFD